MNRSKKKKAHRDAERTATKAMLEGRPTLTNCNWYGCSYSEVQGLFKQCSCKGKANQKRPKLIAEIMQSGRLRRKLRGGQWQLYVRPRRALLNVVIDGVKHMRPIQDVAFTSY
jgi:hypothetical protein